MEFAGDAEDTCRNVLFHFFFSWVHCFLVLLNSEFLNRKKPVRLSMDSFHYYSFLPCSSSFECVGIIDSRDSALAVHMDARRMSFDSMTDVC